MDRYKLEYEMKNRGVTVEKMCADIGMSRSAFYRKCRGISEFTITEIQRIVDYLDLDIQIVTTYKVPATPWFYWVCGHFTCIRKSRF